MNRTQIIGITMVVVGMATLSRYQQDNYDEMMMSVGSGLAFVGAFILWNGWVARVNREPTFALFG
jgi:uncharacterized membrane protein